MRKREAISVASFDEEKSSTEELALTQARYAAIIASSDDAIINKTLGGISLAGTRPLNECLVTPNRKR